ncbi:MAG: MFS transporter [Clostridiales bacterium]|nr:MFS transporter [Clostridiales bacterium]
MEDKTLQKKGLLGNFLNGKFWDSKSTSANVTKRELWLGYVAGPFGVMLLQSIVNSYFNQYLTDVLGFTVSRGAWIALFMVWFPILSKLIDAVTNLLMAKLLDLTTCRQGKLRPWFILSLPIVVVSILLMFWIPVQSVVAQAVWIVISYNLFYSVGYTMWYMAYEMSASLSTRNVKQRSTNSMAGQITKNMGTGIISITFPLILTGVCGLVGGENQQGYLLTMAIICCIAVPLTFLQYFYTRERVTEERRNQFQGSTEVKKVEEASFLTQLKACLKDKYWIMLVVMILTYQVLNALKSVSQVYYSGWVVQGNSYGTYATIQARFTMIAMAPMGPALFVVVPMIRKLGRRVTMIIGGVMSMLGSGVAFMMAGNTAAVYGGTAISGIGTMFFMYSMNTFIGDSIDHVEYSQGIRAEGITAALVGFVHSFSNGIGQGLFNLGLMVTGYTTPVQIGTDADGIALYADQTSAATTWISFSYQGAFVLMGLLFFVLFAFFNDIEAHMPTVHDALQERKRAECEAQGIEYIPAQELERMEKEAQKAEAEENRIRELKEYCAKHGKDFDIENQKVLDKRAKKAAKKAARKARKK